ncbi:MAG TPA: MFS transporter [Terriglobales bacterium]|nr:MFS transporter [Terriglobales bacterium]
MGALVFGVLADRYERRRPLMANVVFFSVLELLCGFAPNYTVFLILRAIYGIGRGVGSGRIARDAECAQAVAGSVVGHRAGAGIRWATCWPR